ncbi:MAG: hypothetical protein LBB67_06355 [Oscillospiraceae bacterium]|nr:hypothetical protein [Oscillospiraceae bacterium]
MGETAPTTDDSLAALGVTYQEEVKTLDAIMDACKRRLQRAQHLQDHTEIYRLQRLLRLHGEQRDDLLDIAYNLIHYYQENVPPARTV